MADTVTYPIVRKIKTGTKYFTLLDEDVYYSLEGALSFTLEDEEVYTQDNYRDELSSGFAGGPAAGLAVTESSGSGFNIPLTNNNTIIVQSDSYTHVAPRNEKRKRTMMYFWDSIDATGNIIACCDYSRFDQFSPGIPKQY